MWVARVKQHVVAIAVTLALTGAVLALAALEAALPQAVGHAPWDLPRWFVLTASTQHPRPGSGWVLALGTLVLAAAAIRLVLLGRAAARQSTTRRGVNVVWDVVAFWPRASTRSSRRRTPSPWCRASPTASGTTSPRDGRSCSAVTARAA